MIEAKKDVPLGFRYCPECWLIWNVNFFFFNHKKISPNNRDYTVHLCGVQYTWMNMGQLDIQLTALAFMQVSEHHFV